MTLRSPFRARFGGTVLLALALAIGPLSVARADNLEFVLKHDPASDNYKRSGIGLRFGPLWSDSWGNWKVALHPELELSRFRYTGSHDGPKSLEQGGVIGLLRLHYGEGLLRPYAEVGLGASMFSRDRLGRKDFSTRFQFSQHLGLGLEFGGAWSVGWQFSHYSNANIKRPNDGIDLYQIVLGARF